MPPDGLSSFGGTRSGKHYSTRPELVVDGRTLGATFTVHSPCMLYQEGTRCPTSACRSLCSTAV